MIVSRGNSPAALLFIVVFVVLGAAVGVGLCRFMMSVVGALDNLRHFGG